MEKDIGNGELQALEEKAGIPECSTKTKASPAFEEVLDAIGSRGKFQTRLNIVFVCFASCFDLMSVNMFYLAMQTPDHWCYVPGRELSNLSVEQWKNLTIPRFVLRVGGAYTRPEPQTSGKDSHLFHQCNVGWTVHTKGANKCVHDI
ncbi:uncharacterized protein LOC124789257 [Schistocerca piceifrons]|uniref:uncharacterized protein LOC124789257 n=1 Tax=Schistocerca piceifrons TaxID=274613 RepID=UPI001F5F8A5D|nr:uncharacterized protein LOC124789257 [Schistocerca piceifrons]